MSHSLIQSIYHVVFTTKYRLDTIPEYIEKDLYNYIWAIIKENNCKLYRIGGTSNHLHILLRLHHEVLIPALVKEIKCSSSLFLKNKIDFAGWQIGYAAISYHYKQINPLIKYITNQKEHHKKVDTSTEIANLLRDADLPFSESNR